MTEVDETVKAQAAAYIAKAIADVEDAGLTVSWEQRGSFTALVVYGPRYSGSGATAFEGE